MRDVPKSIDEAFYAGRKTDRIPFAINDAVHLVDGAYAGQAGSVISIESIKPEVKFLVELSDGKDVVVPISIMRLHDGNGS